MKTIHSYIVGYALSVLLTLIAPALLWLSTYMDHRFPTNQELLVAFTILALLQLFVQLSFFLHIDQESKPRWNLTALTFALVVVGILVGGTLWIMNNLLHGQMIQPEPFIGSDITPQTEQ